MSDQATFFDFAAKVGLTKHIGGVDATQTLVALCHIGPESYVLDVGCGAGVTACALAKDPGCRVMGVDILPAMVERAEERARRRGVAQRAAFRAADAQDLPFADGTFDAVITESVTVFPADKQRAVGEYARVTRPGGYVGLNESAWLRTPVPPELEAWAAQDLGGNIQPLTPEGWVGLLAGAGLAEISATTLPVDLQREAKGMVRRYGLGGMGLILGRMIRLYAASPAYRQFVRQVREQGITPPHLDEYFGYGLYVGRKPGGEP